MHPGKVSAEKCSMVKKSLLDFLASQVPNADLTALDDVIISYVYAAIDAVDSTPDEFYTHVNDFVEIMSAYVKDFYKIDRDAVYDWLMDVVSRLSEEKQKPLLDEAAKPDDDFLKMDKFSFLPKESQTTQSKSSSGASSRSNSTSEDDFKFPNGLERTPSRESAGSFESANEAAQEQYLHQDDFAENMRYYDALYDRPMPISDDSPKVLEPPCDSETLTMQLMTEIFPESPIKEIRLCVRIAMGELDHAIATLIHRREHGQSLSAGSLPGKTQKPVSCDTNEIKSRIIERYSYVDRESECKEHKPLAPKQAAKKMVRYRDNKIVSLKGERFTEVSKGEEEGVKKSNKKNHP